MLADVKAEWGKCMIQYCDQALGAFLQFEYDLNADAVMDQSSHMTPHSHASFVTQASSKASAFL